MGTPRQKKLAQAIVENSKRDKPITQEKVLESVGYPTSTAESQAKRVIAQKGVQEELEVLGFTENKAKSVVAEILENKAVDPSARLKAADMVFKVQGSYAPEKSISVAVSVEASEELTKIAKLLQSNERQELLRAGKSSDGALPDRMDKEVSD